MPTSWRHRSLASRSLALAGVGIVCCLPLRGQGCSQCADTVGQAPHRVQQSYRRGIAVLVLAGLGVCVATGYVVRRFH